MVKAGELGGVLELVLNRLAEFQEKAAKIKNKVIAAMVYPAIVITMAMAIMAFLLVFIVPKFQVIFRDMLGDKPLPAVTQFVIGVSSFVKDHGLLLLGAIVAVAACASCAFGRALAATSAGCRCRNASMPWRTLSSSNDASSA